MNLKLIITVDFIVVLVKTEGRVWGGCCWWTATRLFYTHPPNTPYPRDQPKYSRENHLQPTTPWTRVCRELSNEFFFFEPETEQLLTASSCLFITLAARSTLRIRNCWKEFEFTLLKFSHTPTEFPVMYYHNNSEAHEWKMRKYFVI